MLNSCAPRQLYLVLRSLALTEGFIEPLGGWVDHDDADGAPSDALEGDGADVKCQIADAGDKSHSSAGEVNRVVEVNLVVHPDAHAQHADKAV